jgi:predicted MFS family arabinose efflux permease
MRVIQETTNPPWPTTRDASARWGAVAALAGATFTVVTAEMLPVGLLTPIGGALAVSEGTAGLTLTVTGLVAALSAPLVTSLFGRRDRRLVLCALMALLAVGNLLAALAPSFAVLIGARVLVGFAMGATWAIAAGLAVRLVPPERVGTATAVIFSGVAIASVLGVPAGSLVGELLGWRASFVLAGVLALVVLVALWALLPALRPEAEVPLGGVLRLLRVPPVATGLALVALLVTGHFAAYTYVRPVLEQVAGAASGAIGTLLLVYGVAGVFNGAIALGATVGGLAADHVGIDAVTWVASALAGAALVVLALGRAPVSPARA